MFSFPLYIFLWPEDGPQWPKHVVSTINKIQDSCVLTYPTPSLIAYNTTGMMDQKLLVILKSSNSDQLQARIHVSAGSVRSIHTNICLILRDPRGFSLSRACCCVVQCSVLPMLLGLYFSAPLTRVDGSSMIKQVAAFRLMYKPYLIMCIWRCTYWLLEYVCFW